MKAIIEAERFEVAPTLGEMRERANQVFSLLDISSSTREDYTYRIGLFLQFITEKGFDKNSFLEFKRYLKGRDDLTAATKNKYLASARVFLKELARNGVIPVDITLNVKSFKQSKKHKKEGFQGLRQVEVTRLNVEDLDLVSGIAYIQGKGKDDKEPVYLNPKTVKVLKNYIDICNVGSGALFKSLSNNRSKRLTSRAIKQSFGALFEELGINKTVHGFRHYFITHLLRSFDVGTVRKFSRHKSLDMLIVYDDEINLAEKKDKVFACFESISVI